MYSASDPDGVRNTSVPAGTSYKLFKRDLEGKNKALIESLSTYMRMFVYMRGEALT